MSVALPVNILAETKTVDASSHTTASKNYAKGRLYMITVVSKTEISADPNQPTITGAGLTIAVVPGGNSTNIFDNSGSSRRRQTLFYAYCTASASDTLVIDYGGQTQVTSQIVVDEIKSGFDTSSPIVQSAKALSLTAVTSITATLAAFNSVENATYGSYGSGTVAVTPVVGSGFTQITSLQDSGETNIQIMTEFKNTNDTTVDFTFASDSELAVIGVEIRADKIFRDAIANSGVKASVSTYSWNHVVTAYNNKMLAVMIATRDNDNPTNRPVTGITADGVAMTLAKALSSTDGDGDDLRTEIWILPNPNTGTIAIVPTFTGTVDHSAGFSMSFGNARQTTIPHTTGQDEDTGSVGTTNPDISLTTTKNSCFLLDVFYHQDGNNLTVGTGQTAIAQLGTNGGGDRAAASYEFLQSAGVGSMTWTAVAMDAFCAVGIALESAQPPIKDIIGTGIIPFGRNV